MDNPCRCNCTTSCR